MPEAYDLSKILEELMEDERVSTSKTRKISQEEIKKILLERQARSCQLRNGSRKVLGEALVEEGLISHDQLQNALKIQSERGGKIGSVLVELGYLPVDRLSEFLGRQCNTEYTSLFNIDIHEELMSILPSRFILKHRVLPLKAEGRSITLAMETPNDLSTIHEVEFLTGKRVIPSIVPSYQMELAIKCIEEKGGRNFSGAELQLAHREPVTIQSLLKNLIASKGSDMLITAGVPPSLKVNSVLKRANTPSTTPDQCIAYAKALMTEKQWEDFLLRKELDFAVEDGGLGRFRVNVYRQKNTVSLAIRRIMNSSLSFETLGLPEWIEDFAMKPQGLLLVTAPTGHGKTTSVAAMIDLINRKRKCNIITLEDPIEYLHKPNQSNINQREIGTDTDSFTEGLKRIFRQSPDVILVGEMRDHETFEIAIRAASTGHLVLSTMHASNSTSAIDSMVNRFPHHLQSQVRQQLADALLLVLSQRLVPNREGSALILAYEKLINSFRMKNMIRENKVHQIRAQIQGDSEDFSSIEVSLLRLVREGKITMDSALLYADNADYLLKVGK